MADHQQTVTASTLLRTGKGQLMGLSITATAGAPNAAFYDNTTDPGTVIYEANVSYLTNVTIFFPDRFAPFFTTGLYLKLTTDAGIFITATVWWRDL